MGLNFTFVSDPPLPVAKELLVGVECYNSIVITAWIIITRSRMHTGYTVAYATDGLSPSIVSLAYVSAMGLAIEPHNKPQMVPKSSFCNRKAITPIIINGMNVMVIPSNSHSAPSGLTTVSKKCAPASSPRHAR